LGSATQGGYHAIGRGTKTGWQEDGVSRVFKEFGVPGAIMIAAAAVVLGTILWQAVCLVHPRDSLQQMQIAFFSVGLANLASFAASHQQYSGDPVTSIFVAVWFGVVLGAPLVGQGRSAALGWRGHAAYGGRGARDPAAVPTGGSNAGEGGN
jgi:hypothetical protein